MTAVIDRDKLVVEGTTQKKSFTLLLAAIVALSVGFGSIVGGAFGAWFTWDQAAVQDVVTPGDAWIPETAVRGPLTMWSQADIINQHQLNRTDGLYYAQMDRLVPMLDEAGQPVLDEAGETVMVTNEARMSWIDATALTTALSMGILSYALSGLAMAVGLTLVMVGLVFLQIRKRAVLL